MIDVIFHNVIKVVPKTTLTETNILINWWMWIALGEFLLLIFILIKNRKKPNETIKQKMKRESLEDKIDFNNIINSSFNSKQLYDELKIKCHPDRFPTETEKNIIAVNLFQEITENKNNAKRLDELKNIAIQKLNINF